MSNYTKSTDFASKDALVSGSAGKIVKGTEIDTEFNNIATAIATKADTAGPTFTGTATLATANVTTLTASTATISSGTITGITDIAVADGGTGASTAANARANLGTVADTASNGIAARTSANTLTARTITAGTSITVTDGDGVSGNPTVAVTSAGITATQLASNSVTTAKIADANITPAKLSGGQSGSAPIYAARAWAAFKYDGSLTIKGSANIASGGITRSGSGRYSVTFDTPMANANYAVVGSSYGGTVASPILNASFGVYNKTSTGFDISISDASNNEYSDPEDANFIVMM